MECFRTGVKWGMLWGFGRSAEQRNGLFLTMCAIDDVGDGHAC